jgi:hypothetical protein
VQTSIFFGLWLWCLVDGRSRYLQDPGVFWHTVVGQRILATGEFPRVDEFSFTCGGQPWIAWEWLGGVVLALLHALSGFDGLLFGTATVVAGFYTWVAHRLIHAGARWWVALLVLALALKDSFYHFYARPHLVTLILLGWTFARLCDFEAGQIPFRSLFWLVPAFAVWANAHGGVLAGIGTLGLAVAGWAWAKWVGLPGPLVRYGQLVPLSCLVVGCGLAVLANPYGLELPHVWLGLMRSTVVHQLITEHQPLIRSPHGWTVVLFALVYLAALASVRPWRVRVTWLLPLVWLYLAWTRIRHGPLFATVAVLALAEMLPSVEWAQRLSRWGTDRLHLPSAIGREGFGYAAAVLPVSAVAAVVFVHVAGVSAPVVGRGWATLDQKRWPVELLVELREYECSRPPGTPIFNEMRFGGFLIYHAPGLRVFIDDRCELYGDAGLLAYDRAWDNPGLVDRWARQYGFDRALTVTGSTFDRYLRFAPSWKVVAQTTAATLHERVISPGLQEHNGAAPITGNHPSP